jgi:hypothetical protein
MGKYELRFGAELLDYENIDGIKSLSPLKSLPIFKPGEDIKVFRSKSSANRFLYTEEFLETREMISSWLRSEDGLKWQSEQQETGGDWTSMYKIVEL